MASWTAALKLTLNSSSVTAGLRTVTGGISGAINSMGKLASAGTAAGSRIAGALKGAGDVLWKLPQQAQALGGILSALSGPSKLAADAESTSTAFTVLTGSAKMAASVLAEVRAIADKSPFSFQEVSEAARNLVAFKTPAQDVAALTARLADVSAGLQAPLGEIALLYGKARVAGNLFAEDLNQFMERGVDIMGLIGDQIGMTAAEVKKLASEGKVTFPMLEKAIQSMTNEGGQFFGMMETMSKTTNGRLSSLKDAFDSLLISLGQPINDALRPVMAEMAASAEGLKPMMTAVGQALREGINFAMQAIKDGKAWDFLGAALKSAAMTFGEYLLKALDLAGQIGGEMVQAMWAGLTGDEAGKNAANARKARLESKGIESEGLGINAVNQAAEEARKEYYRLKNEITAAADETARNRAKDEAAANAKREASNAQAKATKDAGRIESTLAKSNAAIEAQRKRQDAMTGLKGGAAAATRFAMGAIGNLTARTKAGRDLLGAPVDNGRGRFSDLGNIQSRYLSADRKTRGSFDEFAKKSMGMNFDKLSVGERAAVKAADPTMGGKVQPGSRADRLAAIQQGQERAKAAVAGQKEESHNFNKAAMLLLQALPNIEKNIANLAAP